MGDRGRILITGASGLLGKCLVKKFYDNGWLVFAHYFSRKGENYGSCEWIKGDFSTLEGTRDFLRSNMNKLSKCTALVNNYGPVTHRDTEHIRSEDLVNDLHTNLVVTHEVTSVIIGSGNLESVVNIAFEDVGEVRPYRKILPYAIAKNGVQLLTLSYAETFPATRFYLVSPLSIVGGKYAKAGGSHVAPEEVVCEIYKRITGDTDV